MVIGTPTPLEEIFIYTAVCHGSIPCTVVVILVILIVMYLFLSKK